MDGPRSGVLAATMLILSAAAGCSEQGVAPFEPDLQPSLVTLAGTCAISNFELWSVAYPAGPEVRLLYDAAANGYVATLRITATSRLSGSYVFTATGRDPLNLGEVSSGALTLVEPDTLRFSGAASLPGATRYVLAGSQLTLVNGTPRSVTLTPSSTWQATTTIECAR